MAPQEQTTTGTPAGLAWKADAVFTLFAEPVRQKLLLALARQPWQPPSELKNIVQRTLDGTMKRLASMRSKGFVVTKADTVDIRRQLYSLAPGIPLITTEAGKVLDFGFLKVPLDARDAQGTGAQTGAVRWEPETIYSILGDPTRRRLIARLERTPGQSGEQLNEKGEHKLSTTLKQLQVLHAAGLVVKTANERDGRRPLYSLAPSVPADQNENGIVLEFGFCKVTLS